jgi:hypothetical protein
VYVNIRSIIGTYYALVQREDTNLIVAQQNSNLFENRQAVAQSNHTTHDHFAQQPVLRKLFDRVWGRLTVYRFIKSTLRCLAIKG